MSSVLSRAILATALTLTAGLSAGRAQDPKPGVQPMPMPMQPGTGVQPMPMQPGTGGQPMPMNPMPMTQPGTPVVGVVTGNCGGGSVTLMPSMPGAITTVDPCAPSPCAPAAVPYTPAPVPYTPSMPAPSFIPAPAFNPAPIPQFTPGDGSAFIAPGSGGGQTPVSQPFIPSGGSAMTTPGSGGGQTPVSQPFVPGGGSAMTTPGSGGGQAPTYGSGRPGAGVAMVPASATVPCPPAGAQGGGLCSRILSLCKKGGR